MHQNFANYKINHLPVSKIKVTNQNFKLRTASGGGTPKPRTPRFASCVSKTFPYHKSGTYNSLLVEFLYGA
jgi:hypothetical protein